MKILLIDVETSPNTAYVWSLWKENIPLQRLIETSEVLCWSAKWLGDDEILHSNKLDPLMLEKIHTLLDMADVVVHYNGQQFDIPVLNKEFILASLPPPAPYKQVDVLRTVRSIFRFTSNKLDHVAQELGLGEKLETTFQLWVECMRGSQDALREMRLYNEHDVLLLEKLYFKVRPWIPNHPNHALYNADSELCCPVCGSKDYRKEGFAYTTQGKYQRYSCRSCNKWFRDRKNVSNKPSANIV